MGPHRDVRYGNHAILGVGDIVARADARRILLVCGRRSFEQSGAARILPHLERVCQVRRWSAFAPNTDATDLLDGLRIAADFQPDLVLGIGGGSAMDMAKLVCAFGDLTDEQKLHAHIRAGAAIVSRDPGLVLVPTTSGSGSEATHFAVVYLGREKFSVAGPALRPDAVVLDPALTLSGSRYQRATSGIDAVAQAIESLWAAGATEASRRWARHALRLLLPAIERYVNEPDDASARAMAIGSHLAGRAIDISRTTAAHALSYGITKRHGVSHGHAVALTLGAFIEAHAGADPAGLQPGVDPTRHAQVMAEILHRLGARDGAGARMRVATMMDRIGLTPDLPDVGVATVDERRRLVKSVNIERLGNNPVLVDADGLTAIIDRAADRAGAPGRSG